VCFVLLQRKGVSILSSLIIIRFEQKIEHADNVSVTMKMRLFLLELVTCGKTRVEAD
jgi:hypothetical protein